MLAAPGSVAIGGAPEGVDALLVAALAREGRDVLVVATDDARLARMAAALGFLAPDVASLEFPAWDCLPYDRMAPRSEIVARRIETLAALAAAPGPAGRAILTTVAAILQRVPARSLVAGTTLEAKVGSKLSPETLVAFLLRNGYARSETVGEAGEFAVRGGIIDVFAPGGEEPLRLDFFGDSLESVRRFDPLTQRSSGKLDRIALRPMCEVVLDEAAIQRFRQGYRARFGSGGGEDPLYESISAGRTYVGMEHWLPLFHERLETLFDYAPAATVLMLPDVASAIEARQEIVRDYHQARESMLAQKRAPGESAYKPLPPDMLYLPGTEWDALLARRAVGRLSPFAVAAAAAGGVPAIDLAGRPAEGFAEARQRGDLFDAVRARIDDEHAKGRRVVVAGFTVGSRDRLVSLMAEHGIEAVEAAETWADALAMPPRATAVVVLGVEHGFAMERLVVIGEQDILGERLSRPARRRPKSDNFLTEVSALAEGDFVVHIEHGIGRYEGLETIEVGGAAHDCLRVLYDGDAKLYVPVENIEVLSRFGSADSAAQLDRLGGAAWQARRARVKKRIREIADQLIRIAAERHLRQGTKIVLSESMFEEFAARFPYTETDDQIRAIAETMEDLASGKPMDRLVCGDVGFGKTEVALRAAFATVMSGLQVAVIVPTTLLARQHFRTFSERFQGMPVRVAQLSRFVPAKEQAQVKDMIEKGGVDIVIGTHALLSKSLKFRDLGLMVVDEEQHFGVKQKERLKELRAEVHVLTLTATPIPRTLQLAMSGVREMSLIATPPVDRLAIRTFVMPYDAVVVREALMREHFRGGQSFYVCPRIEDIGGIAERLKEIVPELSVAVAHGKLPPSELDEVMNGFYDRKYDVLLATNIVESGLDVPTANTLVVHRADMFGLAQLYQIRGRIGRSKQRAYAYLTLPEGKPPTEAAKRRLHVMQTLDTLGAGFTLASHDMDIRGAGNLLGEEQSGHVREVGIELYQQMLEEAVAAVRGDDGAAAAERDAWTPTISIGSAVLIPESYVADLGVRLGLYRRLAGLAEPQEIEAFAAELIDRFGPLPDEVGNLLKVVAIKQLCRVAGIEKIEAGPKGAVVAFRGNRFARPDKLVAYIQAQIGSVKLRPDHRLVCQRAWDEPKRRLAGVHKLVSDLAATAT
ncbi:MAG: transcription-repair coupling factor [Alphaproteobacteria bacterium]|nr:transcription-repair coupling factor [Alphaproteobacteria bacterium]